LSVAARGYMTGLVAVVMLGALVSVLAGPSFRTEIAIGVVGGLLVQAPLGWWTLRSIGTERFQLVWLGGMVIRLVMVAVAALVLAPEYRWQTGTLLLALVGTLLLLLLVEAATAVREHSRDRR
jgi:hypothetical protein